MKLLIVRFSSIGDCVMTAPVASAFRRSMPNGRLVWAVDPRCAPVIATSPVYDPVQPASDRMVDRIFEIPWEDWKRRKVSPIAQMRHYMRLREERFDVGLDLQGQFKTAVCLRLAGAKKRLAARAVDWATARINPVLRHGCESLVEGNLATLRAFGAFDAPHLPMMPIPPEPAHRKERLVTIAVSSGHPSKNYPHMGEVARLLVQMGAPVAFVGGPGDQAPPCAGAEDFVGKLSLLETCGLLRASAAHIASDTGSGHIAAAYGVPVVSIFGFTGAELATPLGPKTVVLDAGPTMLNLPPEQVAQAAWELLP